jgi:site-specific DNA-methyltransferase (adenine-specific)
MGRKKTGDQQPLLGVGVSGVRLIWGDTFQVLQTMAADSIDSIVTDPPYGLEFMGKEFDKLGSGIAQQEWHRQWVVEALRVLKPGGHLIAFGGDRTHHRLMVAVEDAGFEIRTCLYWCFGSGFPKSLDIGKALDRMAGAERAVVGSKVGLPGYCATPSDQHGGIVLSGRADGTLNRADRECAITAPATEAAKQWDGWGTALKPAVEIAVLARKPLGEGTVARNVLRHGVGALHIDACRVEGPPSQGGNNRGSSALGFMNDDGWQPKSACIDSTMSQGRWPAHLLHDGSEEVVEMFPDRDGAVSNGRSGKPQLNCYSDRGAQAQVPGRNDTGSAARFFPTFPLTETDLACAQDGRRLLYTPKVSKSERGEGNNHPTVKPVALMCWLVRLVTPPGGIVLDPFAGSGSTGLACAVEGFRFVGIERERAYAEIAQRRLLVSQLEVGLGGQMENESETRDVETEEA